MAYKKAVEGAEPEQQQNNNHYQESAEIIGNGLLDTLTDEISNPLGDVMTDVLTSQALQRVGENLRTGKTGPLTNTMLNSLKAGLANPFSERQNQIQTWYKPVALLPSSPESIPS